MREKAKVLGLWVFGDEFGPLNKKTRHKEIEETCRKGEIIDPADALDVNDLRPADRKEPEDDGRNTHGDTRAWPIADHLCRLCRLSARVRSQGTRRGRANQIGHEAEDGKEGVAKGEERCKDGRDVALSDLPASWDGDEMIVSLLHLGLKLDRLVPRVRVRVCDHVCARLVRRRVQTPEQTEHLCRVSARAQHRHRPDLSGAPCPRPRWCGLLWSFARYCPVEPQDQHQHKADRGQDPFCHPRNRRLMM